MQNGLKIKKRRLREELLLERLSVSAEDKLTAEAAIATRLLTLASFRFAETVLLYAPIKGELDLLPVCDRIRQAGKSIAFPRCHPDGCTMTYHLVSSPKELTVGAYGIREPSPSAPLYEPSHAKHDLCIVPAVCYDRDGFRVGYGKGYYDRFLSQFGGTTLGLILNRFLLPKVPRGHFDRSVDLILTEKGVLPIA